MSTLAGKPPRAPLPVRAEHRPLRTYVEDAVNAYFGDLDGQPVNDVYEMVLGEVEPPLLRAVLKQTRNNQSQAARMLGLSRGTLRKKLKTYGML